MAHAQAGRRNRATWSDEDRVAEWDSGLKLRQIHLSTECKTEFCVIHNPREHDWDHLPVTFRGNSFLRQGEDGTLYVDPDDYRFARGEEVIIRNSAHCTVCDKDIESVSTHDFVSCACPGDAATSVDGGFMYVRHLLGAGYQDTSIVAQKLMD